MVCILSDTKAGKPEISWADWESRSTRWVDLGSGFFYGHHYLPWPVLLSPLNIPPALHWVPSIRVIPQLEYILSQNTGSKEMNVFNKWAMFTYGSFVEHFHSISPPGPWARNFKGNQLEILPSCSNWSGKNLPGQGESNQCLMWRIFSSLDLAWASSQILSYLEISSWKMEQ